MKLNTPLLIPVIFTALLLSLGSCGEKRKKEQADSVHSTRAKAVCSY